MYESPIHCPAATKDIERYCRAKFLDYTTAPWRCRYQHISNLDVWLLQVAMLHMLPSLKLADAPENGWLEYDGFLLGNPLFSGAMFV